MNHRDVEQFYNNYKKSLADIAHIQRRLLKESYSYEKWYETMRVQSLTLRKLYAQNLKEYDRIINYAVNNPEALSEEVNAEFLVHIDFFLNEGYRDYGVTVPVLKAILPFWEKYGNPGKIMDCYYFLGISLFNSHYYGEACNAFTAALACFDDMMDCPEPYWTYRYMCAAYYRLSSYVEINRYNLDLLLEYYNTALKLWQDTRIPDWMESPKKKGAISSILRTTLCYALARMMEQNIVPSEKLISVLIEQLEYEKDKPHACMAQVLYSKYLRLTGRLQPAEYENMLIAVYEKVSPCFAMGYTYGQWEFTALFDDELDDEIFAEDKMFHTDASFKYVYFLLTEIMEVTQSDKYMDEVSHAIYRYFLEFPAQKEDGFIDSCLFRIIYILVAKCRDEALLIDCLMNIFVHRQMSTAIHETMVARLAKCMTHYLIPAHPEYFCGLCGQNTVADVQDNASLIEDYVYKASLCHDLGKITCTDVIRLQIRKILDEEFQRIKNHPIAGAEMLNNSAVLRDFACVALCHHKFDDLSRGYPAGAIMPDGALRIIVEIVTVCDSIDAMSDHLGRNYANPKSMEVILSELRNESGTRYSERVVAMFEESESLVSEIRKELYENRIQVNYEIYRKYVVPDTKFRPEDEKYTTQLVEEEFEDVLTALDLDHASLRELYLKCRDYSFVVKDGHGTIYGILMGEPDNQENLWIRTGYVRKDFRRRGIGSLMAKHMENYACEDGIKCIYAPEQISGHYDKFVWHNGYYKSSCKGWLMKKVFIAGNH